MATLQELIHTGVLTEETDHMPNPPPAYRRLLMTKNFLGVRAAWAKKDSRKSGRPSIKEQYVWFVHRYLGGRDIPWPALGRDGLAFHSIHPSPDGVLEFKTASLRIFGWFYSIDTFIAHEGREKDRLSHENYDRLRDNTAYFRDHPLKLDPPRFITGNNSDDFLTLCNRPQTS